jgi:UDP-glucose 4-epimerase
VAILVTGGAGYIGRHVVGSLLERGDAVVVADLPSARHRTAVPFLGVDLAAPETTGAVASFLQHHDVTAIVHLAARKRVDESFERPEWYREQNIGGLESVLTAARTARVSQLVFSSTAAVYASSDWPVREDDRLAPANPYGETKLEGESLVAEFARAAGAHAICLRYFNVAGADDPSLAEHEAHNLIPLVVRKLVAGEPPVIYGDDYPTSDGTCVRDYIHVADLAEAHLAALDALGGGPAHRIYNVGTGEGATVREVVDHLTRISGVDVVPSVEPRRSGDPAIVVANPSRIHAELGWRAQRTLDDILASAWNTRG